MIEYHFVQRHETISSSNGSALVQIARSLVSAAAVSGNAAFIVSGSHTGNDVGIARELLASDPRRSRIQTLAARITGSLDHDSEWLGRLDETPEIIYLHNRPWDVAAVRRVFPEARVVLYAHNRLFRWSPPWAIRRVLARFDGVVAVSEFIVRDLMRRAAWPRIPTHVARSAAPDVDERENGASLPEPTPYPADNLAMVLFVGRVTREKGVLDLIQAMKGIPSARLVVVGGRWFSELEQLSRYEVRAREEALRLAIPVQFTGPLPPAEVQVLRGHAALTVIPSRWKEPLGLTVLEAMQSPSAVIATRAGGIPELASDGGVYLVRRRSPRSLHRAIRALLSNEGARVANANAGRVASRRYSWGQLHADLVEWVQALGRRP